MATHSVEPTATGSRATLSIDQHGVIGELFARLTADITRRYLDLEAAGLKRRSEEEQPGRLGPTALPAAASPLQDG